MTQTIDLGGTILVIEAPPPKKTPEELHAPAMARGADCKSCPMWGCDRGPVAGTIRPRAPLIVIGEAPGKYEVEAEVGFVGPSGRILDAALADGGLPRAEVSVTNTILCMPPGDGGFSEYVELLRAEHGRAMRRWVREWAGGGAGLNTTQRAALADDRWKAECARADLEQRPRPMGPPRLVLPADACRPRLELDMAESQSLVTLAVGKQALESVATVFQIASTKEKGGDPNTPHVASIKKQHGAPVTFKKKEPTLEKQLIEDTLFPDGRVLMATYHPAFAMRDKREFMPVIQENIARAARIARRNTKRPEIDWIEPEYLLSPDEGLIVRTLHQFLQQQVEVTVDIETNSGDPHLNPVGLFSTIDSTDPKKPQGCLVRCIGLGANLYGEEKIIVVPFRHMDGRDWWADNPEAKLRIALLVRRVLDELPLVFQNGSFDTTALLRTQLMTRRDKEWTDTLLLHHDTPDNDLPHDLGFITRRYFEVPLWKENVDHKSVDPESDWWLHLYNARDVLATMRAAAPLRTLVEQFNTTQQYITDKKMAVRTRDMSELGLICNEWLRGKYSAILNRQCHDLIDEFQELVGSDINPRSAPQLRELLYVDWGYQPIIATDGYEWEEDVDELEDGSTSNAALTQLMDQRIHDPKHVLALEKLLEFRANDKIRGTNTDNLKTYPIDWDARGMPFVGWAPPVKGVVWNEEKQKDEERTILTARRGLSLVRTTYKGHVVPTGRLASGDPVNFQNIPLNARGGLNLRDMYGAPPGHVLVGADYEQIEARLYAIIAQDARLLDTIAKKLDIHTMNAASLLATPGQDIMDVYKWLKAKPKDELKYLRTVAKRFCFGLIYGAGWQKIYQVMIADRNKATGKRTFPDLQEKDCQEWEGNWHRLHPETRWWHARCHAAYSEFGYTGVPMLDYRKRFFPGGVAQENAIPNLTIQGSAASIANRALLAISELIPYRKWSYWSGLVLQVHDYIAVCVPESRAYEAAAIIEKCMYYKHEGMEFNAFPEITWSWGAQ